MRYVWGILLALTVIAICLSILEKSSVASATSPTPEEGTFVECTDFGSGQSAAVFEVRPGITQVEECYERSQTVPAGPLYNKRYCWRGFAWWEPGTTNGFVFCNNDTLSVKVFY